MEDVKIINRGGRNLRMDIARAICIILVVIGHYSPEYSPQWWMDIRSCIYSFHMPLFMFVSGFVYMRYRKSISYADFLKKKIKRLVIPYFVVSAIIISIKLVTEHGAYVENPVTPMSYLKMFVHPEAGYFLWFIWALWWMFVIIPLFKKRMSLYVLFVASIAIHLWINIPTRLFAFNETAHMLVYFTGGVLIADLSVVKPEISKLLSGKWSLSLLLLFVILYSMKIGGLSVNDMLIAFTGIGAVMFVSNTIVRLNNSNKGIIYDVASASYVIYLFHTTFEGFAKSVIRHFPILIDGGNVLMFSIGAAVVVGCGLIIPLFLHKYVFKYNKFTRIAFGL